MKIQYRQFLMDAMLQCCRLSILELRQILITLVEMNHQDLMTVSSNFEVTGRQASNATVAAELEMFLNDKSR